MSGHGSVRIVSGPAAPPPRRVRPVANPGGERAYALIVVGLTVANTAVAIFDLYLLAGGI